MDKQCISLVRTWEHEQAAAHWKISFGNVTAHVSMPL